MANRNIDKIKLKRSNVSGKIPTLGQLELGEVALNTADAKLYTEYTGGASGSTDIREIGWNRVNITGDTMTGALYGPSISATTIDAEAYYSGGTSLIEIFLASNNNGNIYTTGTTLIGNTIYFDRTDTLSAYTADLSSLTTSGEFNLIEDTTPQLGGNLDINNFDINGLGNIDITGNVISDVVQLRGGVGTQGEMSWNNDEETVQLIMDGTTLHIGQDTFVHARNNTASIITKGTAVYATGTLGASGRITVAPMIADGTIAGRLFIGLAAEDIAIGTDGQVMTFGKIRQINTNAYTDGDVLWIGPTVAGQLTTTEPTAPNLKIATAFVIHAATNGTLMVRAEQGTDLHTDQRVQVSGLTDGDVLTWNGTNNRWENEAPTGSNIYTTNGTIGSGRVATLTDTLSFTNGRVEFNTTTDGILLPRLTTAQMNAIVSPTTNILIYNTDLNGLYRYTGSAWVALSAGYGIIEVRDSSGYPTFYADLQTAINATADRDTVYIHSDIEITSQISVPHRASLTINTNGRRLWCDTTPGDFNMFRFASANTGAERIFNLEGGGLIQQIGTHINETNSALFHFFYVGSNNQLKFYANDVNIRTAGTSLFFNQNHMPYLNGGYWYSATGRISINTANSVMENVNLDVYTRPDSLPTLINRCTLRSRGYGFGVSHLTNSYISGTVVDTNVTLSLVRCDAGLRITNNIIVNESTSVNRALTCYAGSGIGVITNNTIISLGNTQALYLRTGNAYNNYCYSAGASAILTSGLSDDCIGNIAATNATNASAILCQGDAGNKTSNNICRNLNASNTAAALDVSGGGEVFGNTAIVANASAYNIRLTSSVYLSNNIMGIIGLGVSGPGVNLMTNTPDAYGNIKIG